MPFKKQLNYVYNQWHLKMKKKKSYRKLYGLKEKFCKKGESNFIPKVQKKSTTPKIMHLYLENRASKKLVTQNTDKTENW